MNIPTNLKYQFGNTLHPKDACMLVLGDLSDIPRVANDFLKGAILKKTMPNEVKDFLLNAPLADIHAIRNTAVPVDPETGEVQWNFLPKEKTPECLRRYGDQLMPFFNGISHRKCTFAVTLDKGTEGSIFPRFHFDTREVHSTDTMRGVISVSTDELDHETEWVATEGLNESGLNSILRERKLIQEFSAELAVHIEHIGQQDLILMKGLSIHRKNPLTDGCAHRSPPFKNSYPSKGLRRVSLILNEDISDPDFVY